MANRMPMQPGDGSNPAGAQAYYHPQSGTPPQAMYMSFPMQYAQMQQAYTAQQQLQYQTFFENQRRAQADMRNRGAPMQGHPQQQQQQQQQQLQAQQQAQRMAAMAGYPAGMMMHGGDTFEQKSQAEKEAILELLQTQSTTAKAFQQRGMPPQQQQQQQSRMSGYPGVGGERVGTFDPNNQSDKEAMLELLGTKSSNDTAQTSTTPPQQQQQQQQQQRMPGAAEHGGTDSFAHKTQAERDAMVELLPYSANQGRGFASRAQPPPPPPPPPQQQQQQQHRPGMTPGMPSAGMMAAAAVGPHFDPAIATAIASGSPAAAGAPPANMHMMTPGAAAGAHNAAMVSGNGGAASAAAAAGAGRGKIEVEDEYGLKPLVKVLTAAPPMSSTPHVPLPDEPTDPTTGRPTSQLDADEINFSFITRGFDITQLGLSVSQQEWLHPTLATLPLDTHNYFILPEFKIPDSYKKPRPRSLSMKSFHQFKEETLFYIFYSMPRDVLHLAAARALYERGWRYHKREQHWFHPVKAADGTVMESVTTGPDGQEVLTGVFDIFQPNEWKQVRTADKYTVPMSEIEEQSVLVAAMEEAARQQTQRSRAKAAQAAAGAESGSPVNGSPAASP